MKSPIKNMAYWKAKNASPAKSGLGLKHKSDSTGFDMDYDEYNRDGSPNYSDPTDPTSPTYDPNHPGSDYKKKVDPDAPSAPGQPGYEPPVDIKSIDAASYIKGKMLRNKKKK